MRPVALLEHQTSETMSCCGSEAGRTANESLVHDGQLEKVLGQGAGLEVIVVGLADATQEAHRSRPAKLKFQHGQHEALGLENLVDGISAVDHVDNLLHRGAVDLFVLCGNEYGRRSNQLELAQRHHFA